MFECFHKAGFLVMSQGGVCNWATVIFGAIVECLKDSV
jgi:hypothetical protein